MSNKGTDHNSCGKSILNSCRTLKFTVEMIANSNDTILIEGGHNEQNVYYVEMAIVLTKNIRIMRSPFSRFNPILKKSDSTTSEDYGFFIETNFFIEVTLHLESIEFKDINILFCQNTICHLKIHNCTQHMSTDELPDVVFQVSDDEFYELNSKSSIVIEESHFLSAHSKVGISTHVPVTISISKVLFEGGGLIEMQNYLIGDEMSSLYIKDTRFYNAKYHGIYVKGNFHSVNIINTDFYNITATDPEYEFYIIGLHGNHSGHRNVQIRNTYITRCGVTGPFLPNLEC